MHKRVLYIILLFQLLSIQNLALAEDVLVHLKDNRTIRGVLVSITADRVELDPEGEVSLLTLSGEEIVALTYLDSNETLYFNEIERRSSSGTGLEFDWNAIELYLFGGFLLENTIDKALLYGGDTPYMLSVIYDNGGMGGCGISHVLKSGRSRVGVEMSFIQAKMKTDLFNEETILMDGLVVALDTDISYFPPTFRLEGNPSGFLLFGAGLRSVNMSDDFGHRASELHVALNLGFGARWQIYEYVAIQLKERLVVTDLENANPFVQLETRLELYYKL